MAIDLAALKTEITTDPATIGYTAAGGFANLAAIESLINVAGSAVTDVQRKTVTAQEILAEIRQGEYHAMGVDADGEGPSRQRLLQLLLTANVDGLDWSDTQVRNLIRSCFPGPVAPNTRTAIIALETILAATATRAEELFGHRAIVSTNDLMLARDLP